MAHSPTNPSDPFEDFLARERFLAGELSPVEFAEHVLRPASSEADEPLPRWEAAGPLYQRGSWSPLRRAWFCLQIALATGIPAFIAYLHDASLLLTIPLVAATFASLSLSVLLLVRSSAIFEIRLLTRDRHRLRDELRGCEGYAEAMVESLASLASETTEGNSGAPLIRDLLQRARLAMVAAGHEDAALFILCHEGEDCLLTYSSLPGSLVSESSPSFRKLAVAELRACLGTVNSCTIEFELGGRRQELLALSNLTFRSYDRTALHQLATCLSLAATKSLTHHSEPPAEPSSLD